MYKFLVHSLICFLMLAIMTGCNEKEPEVEEPPPPPPPSAQEIHQEMRSAIGVLWRGGVSPQDRENLVNQLNQVKSRFNYEINAPEAIKRLEQDINDLVNQAREAGRWGVVKGCAMAYKVLHPNSDRYNRIEERADMYLERPIVDVTGFMEVDGVLYTFLRVSDPVSNRVESYRVREGEEFHETNKYGITLRLLRVIGNQRAVEIEYKPLQEPWEVPGPRQ